MQSPTSNVRRPRSFLGKLFRVTALVLFLLLGLFLLAVTLESWRGTHKWNKYKKELEAQGEQLNALAQAPPPIPDDQNFACHPLIARLFTHANQTSENDPQALPKPARADPDHDKSANGPSRRRNDTRTDLKRWSDYYHGHRHFPQAPPEASPAEVVRTALSVYDPQIRDLAQAMRERPQCRYPLRYEDGMMMLLPHLAKLKGFANVLQLRALAELHLGNRDQAFEELRLGLFLCDTLQHDPLLINQLVRISMDRMLWEVIGEGIGLRTWNDQQLAWFVDHLARRNYLADYQTSMRTERNFGVYCMDLLRQGRIKEVMGNEGGSGGQFALKLIPRGFFDHNVYHVVKVHQDHALPAADPKERRVNKDEVLNFDHAVLQMHSSPYTIFARLLLPALSRAAIQTARWQTLGDATMIACALERHRLATGAWPGTLAELTPRFLPFLPKDVLNGDPFVFKVTAPGVCRIYTFGWDEKDDQGVADPKLEKGDWGVEIGPPDQTSTR